MPDKKDYPFPLDTFIDENVPVQTHEYHPKTGTISTTVKMEKLRTKYIEAIPQKISCIKGSHDFYQSDKKKWIFTCRNCSLKKKVFPTVYRFDNGSLINKATGEKV